MERRDAAVKRSLSRYGLRCLCLLCGWFGRAYRNGTLLWFTEADGAKMEGEQMVGSPAIASPRLRTARCPRCNRPETVRSQYWVSRFPDRAAQARRYHENLDRAMGR